MPSDSTPVQPSFASRMAEASGLYAASFAGEEDVLHISRVKHFSGQVDLPGSKSIANRALLMAAMGTSGGGCLLSRLPDSEDVTVLKKILPSLGVRVDSQSDGTRISADGLQPAESYFYVENAGTAMRPMLAVLSAIGGEYTIEGNEQMNRRPIGDLAHCLRSLGVEVHASEGGCPPVRISGNGWKSDRAKIQGKTSSQFVSAMLLAAPLTGKDFVLELADDPVSKPYIDLTLSMMLDFGVSVEREGYQRFVIPGDQVYRAPEHYEIEGDASAATYFLAAAAIPGHGPIQVHGLGTGSIQGDTRFCEILESMGARISMEGHSIECTGGSHLRALDLDMNAMPDAAMTLATLNLFADGPSRIRNIANLRVKESERIAGIRTELERTGARVIETLDSLSIEPPQKVQSARFHTYRDHRMAMAFSLVAASADIEIMDPGCVRKTYPDYFLDFARVAERGD
ncbi:MAG: 3-phosphoshikimate 1-carboxyvinyltransferase [Leptospiraceae bacterium]|nr:3-phosphoshikimate 1-carboxyvinyltransferase [Leptospiraceae bacterium]